MKDDTFDKLTNMLIVDMHMNKPGSYFMAFSDGIGIMHYDGYEHYDYCLLLHDVLDCLGDLEREVTINKIIQIIKEKDLPTLQQILEQLKGTNAN